MNSDTLSNLKAKFAFLLFNPKVTHISLVPRCGLRMEARLAFAMERWFVVSYTTITVLPFLFTD